MKNKKAWIISIIFGIIGLFLAGCCFVGSILIFSVISNIFAMLGGLIAGSAVAWGYRIGNGGKVEIQDASLLLTLITLFGFLGVLFAYFLPYVFFEIAIPNIASLEVYLSYIHFNIIDFMTLFMGALIAHEVGSKIVVNNYKFRLINISKEDASIKEKV